MRAIGYQQSRSVQDPLCLLAIELPDPTPGPRDLLVRVEAIAVNPVDAKVRRRDTPASGTWKVLGWDAAGTVEAVGPAVQGFQVGDRVWYAGALDRPGCNAELQLVDERLVARRPASLTAAEAAALPLTAITAWELLFDRLRLAQGPEAHRGESLLVVGAAGGVGSILVQLARRLTGLTLVGTASRPESKAWLRELGCDHVIDHHQGLAPQLQALDIAAVERVISLTHTDQHFPQLVEVLAPQGALALIDDPAPEALNVLALKRKSLSLHWELMFTRSLFHTADMAEQGALLARVAALVDAGQIRSTANQQLGAITADNLRRAHLLMESHTSVGKVVLAGWE
ncbi:zinc-binding alcohol dehydrogenase family protein [Vulcanococcus limneticus Candia 3F8]|uniref:zinc-binding alcohol dehydrogenase family protein n=1 Tax=Vulcanococcus limneticus TaxID=2170428 RepID=UPI000B97F9C6|nr:zinc-binding alcohol dehydrogenase family protein [Vulcanococcus limneticus]MCP9792335.1 zinc-binding alcohol dehydrogenase family protein [Vulcanococcus limneticus MW73D5]MCP9893820.1 zinc-binding alcohol dehydrogenase family protein [Vulcanococcus limneticus Candia 3F8]MCP9897684.1 zinc-binding alcohol dehydrogenase family protein [Vulcanococcus limneticus Candia 3B3]